MQAPIVSAPPSYQYAGAPPALFVNDPLFVAKMQNITNYEVRQTAALLRTATANIWPNHYIISDRNYMVPVVNSPKGEQVPNPVFALEEESGCCCRLCCRGNQPFLARLYHVTGVNQGKTFCGCCYQGHQYALDYNRGPIMTYEREGCCSKWLGCFVCTKCCQNDMYMHAGEFSGPIGATKPESTYLGRSVVPIGAGGLTPTVNLTNRGRGAGTENFATMEGPCIFAGWKGLCCGDRFTISSRPGRSGDLGVVEKRKPKTCVDTCLRIFASGASNTYDLTLTDAYKALSPEDKAIMLGGLMHMNYIIFQNDVPPVMCRSTDDGKGVVIICTLWECWLSGCILPCQICIVLHGN